MTAAEVQTRGSELERIEAWRAEELGRAGYDVPVAEELAARHDVDLHRAVELLKAGCAPHLAREILT